MGNIREDVPTVTAARYAAELGYDDGTTRFKVWPVVILLKDLEVLGFLKDTSDWNGLFREMEKYGIR